MQGRERFSVAAARRLDYEGRSMRADEPARPLTRMS